MIRVGPQARAVAQLFGQSYATTEGMVIPDEISGVIDLTQLLLVRQATASGVSGNITGVGISATKLTVPAGKAWAVLGISGTMAIAAASYATGALSIQDPLGNVFAFGPASPYDGNVAAPFTWTLQAPTQPWPILLVPGSSIGFYCGYVSGAGSTFNVTARFVEINLFG